MFREMQTSITTGLVVHFFFCTILCAVSSDVPRPRGVSLTNTVLYQPQNDKTWFCLDGRKSIPYLHINDDYCDCADGSDEPGTAACSNGRFHCVNVGYKSRDITSSRVNDGICDCCDGSDEYGLVSCQNTCQELDQAEQIKRKYEAELYKKGAEKRQEMIIRGKQLRSERDARRTELESRLREQKEIKSEKENFKRDAEAIEADALAVFRIQHQQNSETEKDLYPLDATDQIREEASASFVHYDVNKDNFVEVAELLLDLSLDRDRNGVVSFDEAKYFLDNRERIDFDSFLTLAWPRIKPLKMLAEGIFKPPSQEISKKSEDTAEISDKIEDTHTPTETGENRGDVASGEEDEELEEDQYDDEEPDVGVGEAISESTPTYEYDPDTQHIIENANEARNAFTEAERSVREIEHEIKEIEDQNGKDHGPSDEYALMDGECIKYEDREYIYTLCPFDRASQKQRSGGAETTLGRWDQWISEKNNNYKKQKYSNGASCWNGPQRSVIVDICCGLELKITSVSEPNRCEYFFELETPAACDSKAFVSFVQNLHDEL